MSLGGSIAEAYVTIRAKTDDAQVRSQAKAVQDGFNAGLKPVKLKTEADDASAATAAKRVQGTFTKNPPTIKPKVDSTDAEKAAQDAQKKLREIFSGAAIAGAVGASIHAASDLNEEVSKSAQIFGTASKAVSDFGKDSADAMGLSKRAYLEATSNLGGLLQNLGLSQAASVDWSTKLAQLGADLGSFFNKDPSQAIDAIGSALRGESEPIRAFNVQISDAAVKAEALKEGLYDGVGAIDANARAQATLQLILQQTTQAQGDFARTADGAANSQRVAKAELEDSAASLGQVLLPVYTKVVQAVGAVATVYGALPGPVQLAILALIAFAALYGPITSGLTLLASAVEAVQVAFATAGLGIEAAVPILGLIAVAVAGAFAAFKIFGGSDAHIEHVNAAASDLAKTLENDLSPALRATIEAGTKLTLGDLGKDAKELANIAKGFHDAFNDKDVSNLNNLGLGLDAIVNSGVQGAGALQKVLEAAANVALQQEGIGKFSKQLADAHVSADDLATAMTHGSDAVATLLQKRPNNGAKTLADILGVDAVAKLESYASTLGHASTQEEVAGLSAQKLSEQVKFTASAAGSANNAWGGITATLKTAATAYQAAEDAIKPNAAAQDALTQSIIHGGSALDGATLAQQLDNDAKEKATAAAAASKAATDSLTSALGPQATKYDILATAASNVASALNKVFGAQQSLEDANAGYEKAVDDLTQSFKDNGKTIDIGTEKGRNNRKAVEDNVKAIQAQIVADVNSGKSQKEAGDAADLRTAALENQLVKQGLTRDSAKALIATMGLTPENIKTAIQLAGADAAKQKILDQIKLLGNIPPNIATEIQTDVELGNLGAAQALIDNYKRSLDNIPRTVTTTVLTKGGRVGATSASAVGRITSGPMISLIGDNPSGQEAVLPLDNPARLAVLANDPRARTPLLTALGARPGARLSSAYAAARASGGTSTSIVAPVSVRQGDIYHITNPVTVYGNDRPYIADLRRRMNLIGSGG